MDGVDVHCQYDFSNRKCTHVSVSSSGVYLRRWGSGLAGEAINRRLLLCLPSLPTASASWCLRAAAWNIMISSAWRRSGSIVHWMPRLLYLGPADSPKCFCCGHKKKVGLAHSYQSRVLSWPEVSDPSSLPFVGVWIFYTKTVFHLISPKLFNRRKQ